MFSSSSRPSTGMRFRQLSRTEDETYLSRLEFSDETIFRVCVDKSTGTVFVYREVKILMIHRMSMCVFWRTYGDWRTFTWLRFRTLLCVMLLWEQFSSHTVHHPTSSDVFLPFWTGSFLSVVHKQGDPFPGALSFQIWLIWTFFSTGLWKTFSGMTANSEWVVWQKLHSSRVHYQRNSCQYLAKNWIIILMCFLSLMVSMLRYTEHARKLPTSGVTRCNDFSSTLYSCRCYIVFHFIAIKGRKIFTFCCRTERIS
jgi:hypothetical protein